MPGVRSNAFTVLICLLTATVIVSVALAQTKRQSAPARAEGLEAWQQVYSVLTHPRCINCHTASNYPEQGDSRTRHFANVVRGRAGTGVAGFRCVTCHQKENADSTGVPGGPNWHLAPLSMKWQDANDQPLSSGEVCRAVTDRSRNENMDGAALLKHHREAALVLWAWAPGKRLDGSMRTLPPLTHDEFVAATSRWVNAGMPCPQK
jgi:mono/diheme cytochrome c family protein